MNSFFVAISGASGAVYGIRFTEVLAGLGYEPFFTVTDSARLVIREELGIEIDDLKNGRFLNDLFSPAVAEKIRYVHYQDLLSPVASGSAGTSAMVVIPCSVSMVARIACGISGNLVERAADVMIKERRRLILVPRETPFSAIHLENMLKLARLGTDIVPACPGFYGKPGTVEDLVDFVAGKVFDLLGIETGLLKRWRTPDPFFRGSFGR
ncbi:MAG TPA: flavin prenyltransferase UbiX [Candidatus Omnitrophota bacterium]|nr:flavin prenyltransferase UbiX [Candidatus Omnitrophota bacterium]